MCTLFSTFRSAALAAAVLLIPSADLFAQGSIRLTEVMSSSGVGGTADWWEITNYGTSSVDISGWKMDDNSFAFANSVALAGVTSIAPGESALFVESAAPLTDIPNFRAFWTGTAGSSVQIGSYTGSGVGLSSAGDGLVLFNATGTEMTPRVTFGAATTGSSFYYSYDSAGSPATSPNANALLSSLGVLDGQVTFNSATSLPQNIGSPGTAINAVPEPSSIAFLGCAAALYAGLRRRR